MKRLVTVCAGLSLIVLVAACGGGSSSTVAEAPAPTERSRAPAEKKSRPDRGRAKKAQAKEREQERREREKRRQKRAAKEAHREAEERREREAREKKREADEAKAAESTHRENKQERQLDGLILQVEEEGIGNDMPGLDYAMEQQGWSHAEAESFTKLMSAVGLSEEEAQSIAAAVLVTEESGASHKEAVAGAIEIYGGLGGFGE